MSRYNGSKYNTFYDLEETPWKSGGEGSIYKIKGNDTCIAKIFKPERRTALQQKKLTMMLKTAMEPSIDTQTTWPKDLIYENGKPIGYIMKTVSDGELLCEINGPDSKSIPWKNKLLIAANLSSAVDSIHNIGHVIGDMNPRNILINRNNLSVTLIDTDSYHIIDDVTHEEYRCNVGMSEYLAPELLKRMENGARLDSISLPTYTKETDRFALAIHIFALLMDGYHPFTCRILDTSPDSVPCPQKKENIVNGFSPYFMEKKHLDIPKSSPKLSRLPKELQTLFRKAFVDGYKNPEKRPSAKDWDLALRNLYGTMIQTKEDTMHPSEHYTEHYTSTGIKRKGCLIASIVFVLFLAVIGLNVIRLLRNIENQKKQEEQFIQHIENDEFEQAGSIFAEEYADTTLPANASSTIQTKIASTKIQFEQGTLSYEAAIQRLNSLKDLATEEQLQTAIEQAKSEIQSLYSTTNLWNDAQLKVDNGDYLDAIALYDQVPSTSPYYNEVLDKQVIALDCYAKEQLADANEAIKKENWQDAITILNDALTDLSNLTNPEATIESYKKQFNTLIASYEEELTADTIESILKQADGYIQKANYENAIKLFKKYNTQYGEHKKFANAYEKCMETYKEVTLVEIKKLVLAGDFVKAEKLVTTAIEILGKDAKLLAIQAELAENEITYLKDMKIVDSTEVSFPETEVLDTIGNTHTISDSLIWFGARDSSSDRYSNYIYCAFADYYIGGNYTTFSTTLVVPDTFYRGGNITFRIFLDYNDSPTFETTSYELADIKRQTLNQSINLDVTNVKWIRIWVGKDDASNPAGQYPLMLSGSQLQNASTFSSLDDIIITD